MGSFHDLVKKVYSIHSRSLPERRRALTKDLIRHSIEAEWIVDFDVHQIGLGLYLRRWRNLRLTRGEVSVYLKHEAAYRNIVAGAVDVAFVLEDDALLPEDFITRFDEYSPLLPADFDLIFFGESCGLSLSTEEEPGFVSNPGSRSANAYLITSRCAQILIDGLHRIDKPIDMKLNEIIQTGGLRSYWSEPPLVGNGSERGVFEHSLGVKWRLS